MIYEGSLLSEFSFGNPKRLSSDAYITFEDNKINKEIVIVFEAKSARILDEVRRLETDKDAINKSIKKITEDPLRQQINTTYEIIKSGEKPEINKNKIYYFISVSMDDFPVLFNNVNLNMNDEKYSDINYGGLYSISIEELEYLCKIISGNLPRSVSFILEEYRKTGYSNSFKNFLLKFEKSYNFKNKKFEDMVVNSQPLGIIRPS